MAKIRYKCLICKSTYGEVEDPYYKQDVQSDGYCSTCGPKEVEKAKAKRDENKGKR